MKYFTAELLAQMNTLDPPQMMQAMEAWDENERRYERRLKSLTDLPQSAFRLINNNCFHDAQVVTISYNREKKLSIVLWLQETLHILSFELTGRPVLREPESAPNFASEALLWLYEELDKRRSAPLLRVLLSNGSELEIPFSHVATESFAVRPLTSKRKTSSGKQSKFSTLNYLCPALPFTQSGIETVKYQISRKDAKPKPPRRADRSKVGSQPPPPVSR